MDGDGGAGKGYFCLRLKTKQQERLAAVPEGRKDISNNTVPHRCVLAVTWQVQTKKEKEREKKTGGKKEAARGKEIYL